MGSKMVIFDGNAAAPDFQDLYLHGEIDGANGMALTMRDVVGEWNDMVPAFKIPINDVPDGWGLEDVSFTFAPEDGHFGNIYYTAGFGFKVCYNFYFLLCFLRYVSCSPYIYIYISPYFATFYIFFSPFFFISLFFSRYFFRFAFLLHFFFLVPFSRLTHYLIYFFILFRYDFFWCDLLILLLIRVVFGCWTWIWTLISIAQKRTGISATLPSTSAWTGISSNR